MPRRAAHLSLDETAVEHLDARASELCVSRSTVVEALARADAAGEVAELAGHVAAVQAEVKAAEAERGRTVAPLGHAARRKK